MNAKLTSLIFDKYNFKNYEMLNDTKDFIDDLTSDEKHFANSYSPLIKKMKKDFVQKSFREKKFFLYNISQKTHKKTNEPIVDLYDNISAFLEYKRDLEFSLNEDSSYNPYFRRELISGQFLRNKNRKHNHTKLAKVGYIEYYNSHPDTKRYFLTFTLPSEYHKYKQKGMIAKEKRHYEDFEQLIPNPKYKYKKNFEKGLIEGLKVINEIHKFFYKGLKDRIKKKFKRTKKNLRLRTNKLIEIKAKIKELKSDRETNKDEILSLIKKARKLIVVIRDSKDIIENIEEYYRVDFVKMIEPHKSLTPHMHSLFFLNKKFYKVLLNAKNATIKKFGLNKKFQDLEIVTTAKASTYISKYLMKELEVESDEDGNKKSKKDEENFFEIYKQYFGKKTRFFTTSNYRTKGLTQKKMDMMYQHLKKERPHIIQAMKNPSIMNDKENARPIYVYLEMLYKKGVFVFEEEKRNDLIEEDEKVSTREELLNEYGEEFVLEVEKFFSENNEKYSFINETFTETSTVEIEKDNDKFKVKTTITKPYFRINKKAIEDKFLAIKEELAQEAEEAYQKIKKNYKQAKLEALNKLNCLKRNGVQDKKFLRDFYYSTVEQILSEKGIKFIKDKKEMISEFIEDIDEKARQILNDDINKKLITFEKNDYLIKNYSKIITKMFYKHSFNQNDENYELVYEEQQYIDTQINLDVFMSSYVNNIEENVDHDYLERVHYHHYKKVNLE